MKSHVVSVICILCFAPSYCLDKRYRSDYEYNKKTDAFYKLHIEARNLQPAKKICEAEGAQLASMASQQDLIQVHAMLKRYPDIGDYVWVLSDGHEHESAEENPIINMDMQEETNDGGPYDMFACNVVRRNGEIKSHPCFSIMPFVCKVEARDAFYDDRCQVYAQNYVYASDAGGCYSVPRIAYNWNAAYAHCDGAGAHLAVLSSEAERLAVWRVLNTSRPVEEARASYFFFAGIRADRALATATGVQWKDVFRTIFNQTLTEAGYDQWSANEPNNAGNREHCGSIFKNDAKYNDLSCYDKFGFICEKEIAIVT